MEERKYDFTDSQLVSLEVLRSWYEGNHEQFTKQERTQLHFVKWLVESGHISHESGRKDDWSSRPTADDVECFLKHAASTAQSDIGAEA